MIKIAKTDLTKILEKNIWEATNKAGTFGCFEVTIGFGGKERVDYMTYDTKGIWRFYEIKVSKQDFYSKAKHTFLGHFNYYVMTKELYEEVKNDISNSIGVYVNGHYCIKNSKKQELGIDEEVLKDSLIRSLSREKDKFIRTSDPNYMGRLNSRINNLERQLRDKQNRYLAYQEAVFDICDKFNLNYEEVRKIIRNN